MSGNVIQFQAIHASSSLDDESEIGFESFADISGEESSNGSAGSYQEGWVISYIDILTLLLTLFVILLAMSHFKTDPTSIHQFDSRVGESVKQNLKPSEFSTSSMQVSSTNATLKERQAEKSEVGNSLVNSIELELPREVQIVEEPKMGLNDMTKSETTLVQASILQQNSSPVSNNEYLNIDTAKLFTTQIDIAKILPVKAASSDLSGESVMQEETQAVQDVNVADVAIAENHEDKKVSVENERNALMRLIENSQLGNQIEISEVQGRVNLVISDHVLFAPASVDLKPEGLTLLEQLAETVKGSMFNISVEGHTDDVPINNAHFPSNWELSTARATMVTRHLIGNGITANRIRAIGYADTHPRANNTTVQGRERNRRVSIVLNMPEEDNQVDELTIKNITY